MEGNGLSVEATASSTAVKTSKLESVVTTEETTRESGIFAEGVTLTTPLERADGLLIERCSGQGNGAGAIYAHVLMDAIRPLPAESRPDLLNWSEVRDLNTTLPEWDPKVQKREERSEAGGYAVSSTIRRVRSGGFTKRASLLAERI